MRDGHRENARNYAVFQPAQQAGQDLLGHIYVLNELIEKGVVPHESLKNQMSALFAEISPLARKMDEVSEYRVLATMQILAENIDASQRLWCDLSQKQLEVIAACIKMTESGNE